MKKLLALFLALAMLLTLVACSGGTSESSSAAPEESSKSESQEEADSEESSEEAPTGGRFDALQTTDEPVSMLINWHNLTPTVNEEPTEEAPKVQNAARNITEEWLSDKPNVTFEWARNVERTEEWITVNYTAHTGPDTLFYWGGDLWVEREMAITLDDIMQSPNYYEPGSPVWQDMFPAYLFDGTESTGMAVNARNQIVAVPVIMAPGSDTAYYYNKDLAATLGLSDKVATRSWAQLKENIMTAREAGYTGTVVYYNGYGWDSGGSWDAQFSLNAAYFYPMIGDNDFNGDGVVDFAEVFKTQWDTGFWYIQNNPAMVEYWEEYLWKLKVGVEKGGYDIDYTQAWAEGNVLYVEEGLWSIVTYASNTELTFEVGMFPPPYQGPESSEYVSSVEWTDAGPYQPAISVAFNVMDPAIQERPEYVLDYVIDWMKFALTNDNLSIQVEEGEGIVGATKGCTIPSMMIEWFKQSFPKKPGGYNYLKPGFTDQTSTDWVALMQEYGYDMIDQAAWMQRYDELLYDGMTSYFKTETNAANQEFWAEEYGEGWETSYWTDTEPVKPPHMA